MRVHYTKVDPTKNITILVHTPVAEQERPSLARTLLERLGGEQVGFLLPPRAGGEGRLEMAGGEFCGNASISAAALLAKAAGLQPGEERTFRLEVSGAAELVCVNMHLEPDGLWGTVEMPLPRRIAVQKLGEESFPVVELPGITHVLVERDRWGEAAAERAQHVIGPWCDQLGAEALGVILTDCQACRIWPLVHVPAARTTVWEQGCGSGSAAWGAYLAHAQQRDMAVDVRQPGGVIRVGARWGEGRVSCLTITGHAAIVEEGICEG